MGNALLNSKKKTPVLNRTGVLLGTSGNYLQGAEAEKLCLHQAVN